MKKLGVTAVELMPVHHHARDRHLEEKGLTNYWGYNSFGYFAPERRFAASRTPAGAVREFKRMVRALHAAGLEVILDVVYNHTAEGNQLGPTLSLKGIDNASYYRLVADDPRYYMDFTGCGNTLNMQSPQVLQLIMDSLRYWVLEMHVDGFRFDLASALARELFDVDRLGAFFDIIHQDPVLSQVKLIAEPWDLGQGGYQVGNFPVLWTEWNGKYRDSVRRFWRGDGGSVSELATRLVRQQRPVRAQRPPAVREHQLHHRARRLHAARSRQLQREAQRGNGEENRDGENNNLSWNCGVEGPTDDPRDRRAARAAEAQLPGDAAAVAGRADDQPRRRARPHAARQQQRLLPGQRAHLDRLEPRRRQAVAARVHAASWCTSGCRSRRCGAASISRAATSAAARTSPGSSPDGREMNDEAWNADFVRTLGMLLSGTAIEEVNERGEPIIGDTLLVLLNGHTDKVPFTLPPLEADQQWQRVFDTFDPHGVDRMYKAGGRYPLQGRSVAVFKIVAPLRERRRVSDVEQRAPWRSAPQGQASAVIARVAVARRACKRNGESRQSPVSIRQRAAGSCVA